MKRMARKAGLFCYAYDAKTDRKLIFARSNTARPDSLYHKGKHSERSIVFESQAVQARGEAGQGVRRGGTVQYDREGERD